MAEPVTPASIAEAAAAPAQASGDQGSAQAHPIPDQIAAHQYTLAAEAAEEAAAAGGTGSAWNMTRPARAVPPGAT